MQGLFFWIAWVVGFQFSIPWSSEISYTSTSLWMKMLDAWCLLALDLANWLCVCLYANILLVHFERFTLLWYIFVATVFVIVVSLHALLLAVQ
eukprot:m.28300 g.28300  ORF g.28300 m.28300 type:complete len:93 (+) comp9036_c0_seq1:1954-2232(+)